MANEITTEIVFAHIVNKKYFSEEEFFKVPKILAEFVRTEKLELSEAIEFAEGQAEFLGKEEVFMVCMAAMKFGGINIACKQREDGRPYELLNKYSQVALDFLFNGKPGNFKIYQDYLAKCGLKKPNILPHQD